MKLKSYIILIALFSTFNVKSQTDIGGRNANYIEHQLENYFNDVLNSQIGIKTVTSYENIKGNPYLYKEFTNGTILFKENKNIVGKLRYNMYSDEVEFMHTDRIYILVYEDSFSGIQLGDYNIVQLPDPYKENKSGYFIYLARGKYNLIYKKRVSFLNKEEPKIYVESKPGRFENKANIYYLKSNDNELYRIKTVTNLKKHSKELALLVKEYSKENKKIKINEKDLSTFFNWLNSK